MKNRFYLFLPALLLLAVLHPCSAMAQEKARTDASASAKLTESDQEFIAKAAEGGLAEVKFGTLANKKGERDDVKGFGRKMVQDHGKAGAELAALAEKKGILVPGQLSPKDLEKFNELSKLSGEQFDRAYIAEMVEDHKHDVAEFEKAAKSLNDPDLKAFAERTLPILKFHLEKITKIENAKQ